MSEEKLFYESNGKDLDRVSPGSLESAKARTFERMLRMALPDMEMYQSDFYHDARFLRENVEEGVTFYFGWRRTGTSIGFDKDLVVLMNDENVMAVTIVHQDNGWWIVSMKRVV